MSRRAPVAVLLLTVLFSLPTIAHASPTDPVWIPGFITVFFGLITSHRSAAAPTQGVSSGRAIG
jgi:hypothetical protein